MLKRKLEDGTVVGLSLEAVQGGVLLTIDRRYVYPDSPGRQLSFMLNPVDATEFIDGLKKDFVRISSGIGRTLKFEVPASYTKKPIILEIEEKGDRVRFPLREHEIRFIRKALESMAASLLFVGTWSGEPEEL